MKPSSNSLTIEEKIARLVSNETSLNKLPERIRKMIEENLDESLRSDSEYIKQTAEKLKRS